MNPVLLLLPPIPIMPGVQPLQDEPFPDVVLCPTLARFRFLGFIPLAIGIKRLLHIRKTEVPVASIFNIFSIAAITLANGGDNLGVYVPFFAVNSTHLGVILATYTALLPIWCFVGKWLGERPLILRTLDRYGHWFVPAAFIGLGLYILI